MELKKYQMENIRGGIGSGVDPGKPGPVAEPEAGPSLDPNGIIQGNNPDAIGLEIDPNG